MIIQRITICDFGAAQFWETALLPELNILGSRYTGEIRAAMEILLCSKAMQPVPPNWVRSTTRLTARILLREAVYTVTAAPCNGRLAITAKDSRGADVTTCYKHMLSSCPEQDALGCFDGQDRTIPLRLCWYRNHIDAPGNIWERTANFADTQTFRAYLLRYIQSFPPEPIHCKKKYQVAIDPRGEFMVFCPGMIGDVHLSETEEKLFHYICFLNLAEFWSGFEMLRDLHYEKKPLIIQNVLEFLDESTDISSLIKRTFALQRQVILLTSSTDEEMKMNYPGKDGCNGILFKSGNGICAI